MNQRLKEAASSGDIDSLYSIIEEDAYVLDRIDQVPFVDTPLHISASAGHVHFSLEIMRLKPTLAKKLNPKGYSPIHLALQNNQTEVVFRLVDIDRDLVSIQGREGSTPLHIAAFGGKDEVMAKFLVSCPKSIKELTVRKESALHIVVKNGNIEALKFLLKWIRQARITSILDWRDEEGNNIMHLATLGNQIEMVKLLLKYKVDFKSKNLEGLTALDMLREREFLGNRELRRKLKSAHIEKQLRLPKLLKSTLSFLKRLVITDYHEIENMSKEDRNAILVVAVLIATATYQAMLSPPLNSYGFWRLLYFICFSFFNTMAFFASMIEICLHLPSGIGYTLHLVLPLVLCFVLLMPSSLEVNTIFVAVTVIVLILMKMSILRQKILGDLKPKKTIQFDAKRSPSLQRELTQINVHQLGCRTRANAGTF